MITADAYRRHLRDRLASSAVPFYLWEGLVEYLVARRPTGGFLTAVLTNDLMEACTRADLIVKPRLIDVVLFLVNYAPAHAWGSAKTVGDWLASTEPVVGVFE